MKTEITNARRFTQITSIVLFFCLISDFPQPCDLNKAANCALVKVDFLGIQFSIERWMVIMGVPLISAYAAWMYWFFGFCKNKTPKDTRKDLEEFTIKPKQLPVDLLKGKEKVTVGDFRLYVAEQFPGLDPYCFEFKEYLYEPRNYSESYESGASLSFDCFLGKSRDYKPRLYTIFGLEKGITGSVKSRCRWEDFWYEYPLYLNLSLLAIYVWVPNL